MYTYIRVCDTSRGATHIGSQMTPCAVLAAQNVAKMEWFDLKKKVTLVESEGESDAAAAPAPDAAPAEAAPEADIEDAPATEGEDEPKAEGEEGVEEEEEAQEEEEEEEKEIVIPELEEVPGMRHSHGMTSVEGVLYCFGGVTKINGQEWPNNAVSVGEFKLEGKSLSKGDAVEWSKMTTNGDVPCPRSDFAVTALDGKIIVQGGRDFNGAQLDDIYALDPNTGIWTVMYRSDFQWQKLGHSMSCIVGKRMVMLSAKDKDDGKSKYDDVRILEFGKIVDSHAFLSDMQKRINKEIQQLEAQNKDFNAQLQKDPTKPPTEDEQRDMLLLVKNVIYTCKMEQPKIELQMDILIEALSYIQKQGVQTEKMDNEMKSCSENFSQVKKQLPIAAEIIKPVQEREGNKIKSNIEKFTLASKVAIKDFGEHEFNKYETGVQAAYDNVVAVKKKYFEMDKELETLVGYATVFEFPEITNDAVDQVKELHTSLNSMLQLWHMTSMVNTEMDVWSQTLWNDINVEQMEDGTKSFYKQLRALDKVAKTSNAYAELERKVKGFLTALPLVTDLRHPSMRPRHWDMLRELTGKQFDETSAAFDLKTLNDLHLDEFEEDVGENHSPTFSPSRFPARTQTPACLHSLALSATVTRSLSDTHSRPLSMSSAQERS